MKPNQTCPICSGSKIFVKREGLRDDRFAYPGVFILMNCETCEHLFLNHDFTSQGFTDLYTHYYPRSALALDDFSPNKLIGGIRGWFLGEKSTAFAWVPEKVRILDLGCGFGQSLAYHQQRGCVAVGIEADQNVTKVAKKFDLDIRIGIFSPDLVKDEKFDYITLDQVLEHMPDPVKSLREMKSVLTPNGRIVITIPNAFGVNAKVFGRKWIHWHTPYHLHFFSFRSLRRLLEEVGGLEIESVDDITHSHWIFYQFLSLVTYPAMGEKSPFWALGKLKFHQKVFSKIFGLALKLGIFGVYTRILDGLKMGDNRVVIFKLKSEPHA